MKTQCNSVSRTLQTYISCTCISTRSSTKKHFIRRIVLSMQTYHGARTGKVQIIIFIAIGQVLQKRFFTCVVHRFSHRKGSKVLYVVLYVSTLSTDCGRSGPVVIPMQLVCNNFIILLPADSKHKIKINKRGWLIQVRRALVQSRIVLERTTCRGGGTGTAGPRPRDQC